MKITKLCFRLLEVLWFCFLLMGRALVEGCACADTMDDIIAQIGNPEIPVCGGRTIEFSGEPIDVTGMKFRLFSIDCNGNDDESVEPAVLVGNRHFSTNEGSTHNITLSNVTFVQKDVDAQNCIHTKGTGGILDVLGCAFEGISTNKGRAILNEQGTVNVRDCSFDNHHMNDDGAAILNYANMTIKNSTFSGNQAWQGGAIFNRIGGGATIAIESSTFDDNLASNSEGGAIFNQGGALAIKSSNFSGNQAESSQAGWGGAIFAWGSQNMIQATMFVGNEATNFGGAIVCAYSSCEISGSTFKENVAKDDFGGAILVQGSSRLVVVSYNDFVANKDKTGAGAVYLIQKSICNMQGNNFTDNTSGGSEIIHVARMDGPSEFECSQGNTFNPPQELLLPLECDVDRTGSPTFATTSSPTATGAPSGSSSPTDTTISSPTASPTSTSPLCNSIIEANTMLSEDVLCNCDMVSSPLITLQAVGMTLDMNGYTVKCMDSSTTKAEACITIAYKWITVKNGAVANCDLGIAMESTSGGNTVDNVVVTDSTVGIHVSSGDNVVKRSTIDAEEVGIKIGNNGARIEGNVVISQGDGVELVEHITPGQDRPTVITTGDIIHNSILHEGECIFNPANYSEDAINMDNGCYGPV